MKKNILALAIGGVLSAGAQAATIDDILITEYVEPNGGNIKAVEISNLGSGDFTFPADIYISKQQNGDSAKWGLGLTKDAPKKSLLDGKVLAENKTIVFLTTHADADDVNTSLTSGSTGTQVIRTSLMGHNGNDALALVRVADTSTMDKYGNIDGSKKTILDIIGVKDSDAYWGKDQTLRRKVEIKKQKDKPSYNKDDWNKQVNPKNAVITNGLGTVPSADPQPPKEEKCSDQTATTIAQVQGPSWSSPLIEEGKYQTTKDHYVTGLVSAVTKGVKTGFYLYASDGDNRTSDGLFVETGQATSDLVGKTVCVKSKVYEKYGMTQLVADKWEVVDSNVQNVPVTALELIEEDVEVVDKEDGSKEYITHFKQALERHEGMLIKLPEDIDPNNYGHRDAGKETDQSMRVTRNFSFDYDYFRNNMVLSYDRPNMHPNQEHVAGSPEAIAQAKQNADFQVVLESNTDDDHNKADELPYYPALRNDPAKNYIRINDSVSGLEGVLVYRTGYDSKGKFAKPSDFAIIASDNNPNVKFEHNTPRESAYKLGKRLGKVASGDIEIKVATQNVLNYFNSPFGGDYNTHGDNRGATSYSEFEKQQAKIVSSIRGLNADIIGLMEIENNGFDKNGAIATLVDQVNLAYDEPKLSKKDKDNSMTKRYAFIGFDSNGDAVIDSEDSIGGDAITTGMLYRPAKVTLDAVKIIPMPSQHGEAVVNDNGVVVKNYTNAVLESGDNYMRDTLAATFIINQTGKKLTVAVNHLKSKGSTCVEDWDGVKFGTTEFLKFNADKALLDKYKSNSDHQGNCEHFRVAAAVQLGEELEKISGDKVIVGDMNSYAQEDPMLVLTQNETGKKLKAARNTYIGREPQFGANGKVITKTYGYLNAVSMKDKAKGEMSWSYSFGEEIGSLDHILITPSLNKRLVDATDWHINAPESTLFDYNEDKKGEIVGAGWWDVKPDYDSLKAYYADDAFRSSDHDSAIMVLGYKPGETENGEAVHLTLSGGWLEVPYSIPAKAGALKGDIAEVTLTNTDGDVYVDMNKVNTPKVALSSNGQKSVNFELIGAKASTYTVTMTLKRDGKVVPNSTVSMDVEVAKQDSLTPKVMVPEYDETGGSFGMFSIMSLLGLGFLRRRKA